MGCQNKQVKPILVDLANAVAEMEMFLAELKKKQEAKRLRELENAGKIVETSD
jgi:hypothetical protein